MAALDPAKLQKIREHLRHEWTNEKTVAAWRRWYKHIAQFTRGATEAIIAAAQIKPGMNVLDLASGVGDPALAIAMAVGPSGHVTATDLNDGMFSLGLEVAATKCLKNITFREADAESLPFPESSFDAVTCRFGLMFVPDQVAALAECRRVLKPGCRVALVAWGKRDQPFFTTTAGVMLRYVAIPAPDPDAPNMFMFGEPGLLSQKLKAAGFAGVTEEIRTIPGRWTTSLEQYWEQFTEVAAPFRPVIEKLTPECRGKVFEESRAELQKYWNGKELNMPLEIVVGSGTRA
jgi:ubiquinone/menaquinone biosynthesis C-methylase UbiE